MSPATATKVLIVDDNVAIHADFAVILKPSELELSMLNNLEQLAFGGELAPSQAEYTSYALDSAYQGEQALECVQAGIRAGDPYALAFVDMRMPPGWDGVQTVEKLWDADPDLQVVICSAFSDYDWDDVLDRLHHTDKLLVIKKPFEAVEVLQCANALTRKWNAERSLRRHLATLEETVKIRTASLAVANDALREEIRLRHAMEVELRLAQKLESVGRLAAGIAHEINTPIQYVSDNVNFLQSAFDELLAPAHEEEAPDGASSTDLTFLRREVPLAIGRALEGTGRVADIVRAMNEFARPERADKTLCDINRTLEATLLITKSEYKHVASVRFDAGDIPNVYCHQRELGQVFLNLLINSAHALADAGRDTKSGLIELRTFMEEKRLFIEIEDNGCGIAADIVHKIYDPFFTTKEVGRGSGQGLAIAHSIVVDKHGGKINVASTPGTGTVFTIELPVCESSQRPTKAIL